MPNDSSSSAMPKSPINPRIVIYVSKAEMKTAKAAAKSAGLRSPHIWAGQKLREILNAK